MGNKYVDFVSDSDFEECVKKVWLGMSKEMRTDEKLKENGIDPIKMLFDMKYNDFDLEKWKKRESDRQNDKTGGMDIGDFHQNLLGLVKGWTNLGKGDISGLDLKKDDNSIFMEIKNKDNDLNSKSEMATRRTLYNQHKKTPDATIYFGYVIPTNKKSEEKDWDPNKKSLEKWEIHDEKIRRISGKKLYELVTGKKDALEQVYRALPLAIKNVSKVDGEFSKTDLNELEKWFKEAF